MEQFVLVADVLGFSAIMRNVPGELRSKRLDDWLGAINRSILPDQRRQVVSDTVFVTAATSEDGLRGLIQTARHLLEQGVVNNLPIRGAIARGDVDWQSDALWGPGVVEAYSLGQSTEWLGVVLAESTEPIPDALFDRRELVTFPTPFKEGPVRMYANVRWAAPPASALAGLTTGGFLTDPKESLGWSWMRKLQFTSDFRLYLDLIDAAGMPCSGYTAVIGSHLQEKFMEVALPLAQAEWADWRRPD